MKIILHYSSIATTFKKPSAYMNFIGEQKQWRTVRENEEKKINS
jgi:hypothetical protein